MSEPTQAEELAAILRGQLSRSPQLNPEQCVDIAAALLPFIERVKEEAWDEGFNAGFDVGVKRRLGQRHDNPYRTTEKGTDT